MEMTRIASRQPRGAFTLVELLIVLAIMAVLLALLLAAVVRVREAGVRAESQNHLRQLTLAVHHFADAHNHQLPRLAGPVGDGPSLFVAILPFLENGNLSTETIYPPVPLFLSPADPTIREALAQGEAVCSYAANTLVFEQMARLPDTFSDGMSNTVAFAEHYGYKCQDESFYYWITQGVVGMRRATFADMMDVTPVTSNSPPVTVSSSPGKTFQAAPSIQACSPSIPQTPHASGMLVALCDGSVRVLSPGTSETTFWGAVTPAGSEILGNDW